MAQKYLVRIGDNESSLELRREGDDTFIRSEDGAWKHVDLERVGDSGLYLLMVDNKPMEIYLERKRGGALATIGRHAFECEVGPWRPPEQRVRATSTASSVARVVAPMTGSIVELRCAPGQPVAKGDVLLVMESMKMNNELRSPTSGIVETVPVMAGQRVGANEILVTVKNS